MKKVFNFFTAKSNSDAFEMDSKGESDAEDKNRKFARLNAKNKKKPEKPQASVLGMLNSRSDADIFDGLLQSNEDGVNIQTATAPNDGLDESEQSRMDADDMDMIDQIVDLDTELGENAFSDEETQLVRAQTSFLHHLSLLLYRSYSIVICFVFLKPSNRQRQPFAQRSCASYGHRRHPIKSWTCTIK